MYQETLERIVGIEIFPIISLILFVAVFAGAVYAAVRMDRRQADSLAHMPLDEERR